MLAAVAKDDGELSDGNVDIHAQQANITEKHDRLRLPAGSLIDVGASGKLMERDDA